MLVQGETVYLFSCGPNRIWTYRVNSLGEEKRLADSLLPGLTYPGPLYDDDMDYCYLLGEAGNPISQLLFRFRIRRLMCGHR